jgi:hypothetical protein
VVASDRTVDWLASSGEPELPPFDRTVAHPARVYDYWLGGKDNFAADREAAQAVVAARPTVTRDVRANRAFMRRAVAYLAAEAGMRQFLDIGTGIPTSPNVHEVVQDIAPAARIVYVDNDPVVLTHAKALLTSSPHGAAAFVDADLRDPDEIVRQAGRTLDLSQPVAVVTAAVLHLISDEDAPSAIIARLMDAVPPGSYLVLTHPASDVHAEAAAEGARRYNELVATPQVRRSYRQVCEFLRGLDIVGPGVMQAHRWHPDPGIDVSQYEVSVWAVVARKP